MDLKPKIKKELRIKIGEQKELEEDINRFFDNPGLIEEEPEEVLFLTPEQFSSIFTKNRIKVLKTIGDTKPKSMADLVGKVGRSKESVSRDINFLGKTGIIKIEQYGKYRRPEVVGRNLCVSF